MPQENSNVKEKSRLDIKEPKKYNVIFHNDDFTPMEFVTHMLVSVFHKNPTEAETLMLQVHHSGKAVVGTYSYDIAMTKCSIVTHEARAEGFPLRVSVQEV